MTWLGSQLWLPGIDVPAGKRYPSIQDTLCDRTRRIATTRLAASVHRIVRENPDHRFTGEADMQFLPDEIVLRCQDCDTIVRVISTDVIVHYPGGSSTAVPRCDAMRKVLVDQVMAQ